MVLDKRKEELLDLTRVKVEVLSPKNKIKTKIKKLTDKTKYLSTSDEIISNKLKKLVNSLN